MARKLDEGAVERMRKSLQERFGDPIITINGNQTDGTNTPTCKCGGMMDLDETCCTQCGMMSEAGGSSMHEDMLGKPCRECRKGVYKKPDMSDGEDNVFCSWCGAKTKHYRYVEPES